MEYFNPQNNFTKNVYSYSNKMCMYQRFWLIFEADRSKKYKIFQKYVYRMSNSFKADLSKNGNAELINIIYPGIKSGINSLVTRNSQYFAYSTFLSVYIYEQKTLNIINIITKNKSSISTISFAQKDTKLIAISFHSNLVEIINVVDNKLVSDFTLHSPTVSVGWLKQDTQIVCFTRFYSEYYIYDVSSGQKIKSAVGAFDNIRVLAMTDADEPIYFGGNYVGTISRFYKGKGKSVEYPGRNNVVTSAFDPNNQSQCLIVWKQCWALFDVTTGINVIHEVTDLSYSISSATWSSFIPGQFYTGDEVTGNIRIWNGPSTVPLEILNIYSAGVSSMVDLKRNCLLIGFVDGMVGVYDVENRKFIFQNISGHCGPIFDLKFHPTNPEVLITSGREGAVCTWNTSTMKQIDRITSFDSNDHFNSMDVSPGGGMIACGFVDGLIAFFSLQTKLKIFEFQICKQPLISLNFSLFEPELIITSSLHGFCSILNVQERKIVWRTQTKQMASIAAFSIHHQGQIIVTTETGSILIFNGMKENPDIVIDDLDKPKFFKIFFSPYNKDIILTSEKEGNVKIVNIVDKTISLLTKLEDRSWSIVYHPIIENLVAVAAINGDVTFYDTETKSVVCTFSAHQSPVLSMGFSPINPNLLVTAASDSSIKFWSINSLFYKTYIENIIKGKFDWVRPIEGHHQLIKLARRCLKLDEKFTIRSDDINHINDILRITKKTVHKSMSGSIRETSLIRRALKNKERMIHCAKQDLFMGDAKSYCELMFASGNFDLAVAAAPAVSVKFWMEMMKNRAKLFDSKNDFANCMLAIGDVDTAIESLNTTSEYNSAFLISAAQTNKESFKFEIRDSHPQTFSIKRPYIDLQFNHADIFNEYRTGHAMAESHLKKGQIYLASASYLSVGDVTNAELLLMIHGETPSAFLLDSITKTGNQKVRERFASLSIQSGIDKETVMNMFSNENDLDLKKRIILSFDFTSPSERENFFVKNGLQKPSEYSGGETLLEQLHNLLLSGKSNEACEFIISQAKENMKTNFIEIEDMVKLIELVNLNSVSEKVYFSIVSLSLYFAIYRAIWKGYKKVLKKLQTKFSECASKSQSDFLKNFVNETNKAIQLSEKSTDEYRILYTGFNYLNPKSVGQSFDRNTMLGKQYYMDDKRSSMDLEEALMWFDLTPFSPLNLKVKHYVV